jgi:kynurenine 3-monooxygenase
MSAQDRARVTIIGAGMSGLLLATLLGRRGLDVEVYERQPDPRSHSLTSRQSVDLTLGERARHALDQAGLLAQVDALCTPVRGRMIHDRSGRTTFQPYGTRDGDLLYSVRRQRLRECLLTGAESSGRVTVHFGLDLKGIDWDGKSIHLTRTAGAGDDAVTRDFEVLIGADGPVSAVRREMQRGRGLQVAEELLDSGYKALTIPPDGNGAFRLDPDALHVWPRGGYMLIGFPDLEGSFSAMLFLPRCGDHRMLWGFQQLDSRIRQRAFMQANFPDAVPLMPNLENEFRDSPVGLMGTIRCDRWHDGGRALLIGDAAHTVVPFHGQGVNAAFEDCTALIDILDSGERRWSSVFAQLQKQRQADAEALAEMSLDAYRTMRESVRHRDFMLRKALERELERRHPGRFVARYSLVMFHRLPYREAWQRGKVQTAILDELLDGRDRLTDIDLALADRLIGQRLGVLGE